MFLRVMNDEERENFLGLLYFIANIDGEFASEEEEIINSYKNELGIETIKVCDDIDTMIAYFEKKPDTIKKIVVFEIIGLINADNKVEKEEKEIFSKIVSAFKLENECVNKINELAEKLQEVYDEIFETLFD